MYACDVVLRESVSIVVDTGRQLEDPDIVLKPANISSISKWCLIDADRVAPKRVCKAGCSSGGIGDAKCNKPWAGHTVVCQAPDRQLYGRGQDCIFGCGEEVEH